MQFYDSNGNVIKPKLPNVVLMGDSITDNVDDYGWWVDIIPEYVEFQSLKNYACGFARWTLASGTTENLTTHKHEAASWNVIWNQVNRLKADVDSGATAIPDVILILAGTNDVSLNQNFGTIETAFDGESILDKSFADIATMAQSIRYTCEYIRSLYPYAQVILATPMQRPGQSESSTAWQCRDIIIGCARNLSLCVIDQMAELGVYGFGESTDPVYLGDWVHPNRTTGSRLIARFIAKQLAQKVI